MTAIELYKFVKENEIEWHWRDNNGELDVILFPSIYHIEEFNKILAPSHFDDGGIKCRMMHGYFCFWMRNICEYYGIKMEDVFEEKEED